MKKKEKGNYIANEKIHIQQSMLIIKNTHQKRKKKEEKKSHIK